MSVETTVAATAPVEELTPRGGEPEGAELGKGFAAPGGELGATPGGNAPPLPGTPGTRRAEGEPLAASATSMPQTLGFLLDVRLTVSVEVGRVQMPVRQVMALGPGSVIELQRGASEPVEVLANGRCIARGEIVVVGEQFGVRIIELGPG